MIDKNEAIITAFEKYKRVAFNVDVDLNFWTSFIDTYISTYQKRTDTGDELYIAGFAAYDYDPSMAKGYLKMNCQTRVLRKADLKEERLSFFTWIRNLAILKTYNALEIFLIDAIWITYFSAEKAPSSTKKASDNLQNKIKQELALSSLTTDSKNNRYLIEFLKYKVAGYSQYLDCTLRKDITTTWGNYFEMISVLRNVIAHQGTIINIDTLNEIKSKANDIFLRHFVVVKDEFRNSHLQPKEEDFSTFISIINEFGLNTVKFVLGQSDLGLFNML